jgi:hypothetical protein
MDAGIQPLDIILGIEQGVRGCLNKMDDSDTFEDDLSLCFWCRQARLSYPRHDVIYNRS